MNSSSMMPIAIVVGGLGIGYWWYSSQDKTPVGLVVVNAIEGGSSLGETSDGTKLTTGAVEGTWRADENSLSVISESAEKPLMVIYEDGTPIHAEVITMTDYQEPTAEDYEENEEGLAQRIEDYNTVMEMWRTFAKNAGATEESYQAAFPLEETGIQAAESIYGPMLSLQSNFVW